MSQIVLDSLTKVFAGDVHAVDDVSLLIKSGEFMVLVGPSGCGKSTLLRMIAGLEEVTDGTILLGEEDVTHVSPRNRDIAMVFQNYALYPHMTVRQNLGFGLKVRKMPKPEIRQRVDEVSTMLGLEDFLERRPAALSGGQRQRVAMGRAIVRKPAAFLMDEPLSNLDAKLRVGMRAELSRLHERLGVTTVYVTHDQVEAMTLGQRVAVMRDGTIQQVDEPQVLYHEPANLFVAAFIGSPSMNLVEATIEEDHVRFGGISLPLDRERRPTYGSTANGKVILGIRPGDFEDLEFSKPGLPTIEVSVAVVEELGNETHVIFPVDAPRLDSEAARAATDEREEAALLAEDRRALFNAQVDWHSAARPGRELTLAVDPSRFHFFHPDSGDNLARPSQPAAALA